MRGCDVDVNVAVAGDTDVDGDGGHRCGCGCGAVLQWCTPAVPGFVWSSNVLIGTVRRTRCRDCGAGGDCSIVFAF